MPQVITQLYDMLWSSKRRKLSPIYLSNTKWIVFLCGVVGGMIFTLMSLALLPDSSDDQGV
jgi:hypothetical protein